MGPRCTTTAIIEGKSRSTLPSTRGPERPVTLVTMSGCRHDNLRPSYGARGSTGSLDSSSGVGWCSWNEQGISFVASPRICLHGKRQVYRLSWADDDSRYWLFFRASQHAVDDSGFWTAHQRIPFFGNRSGGGIGATLGRSGHCGRRRDHSAGPKGGGSDPRGLLRVHERSEAICRTSRRGVSGAPKTPQTAALGRYWTRPLAGENPPRFARFKSH